MDFTKEISVPLIHSNLPNAVLQYDDVQMRIEVFSVRKSNAACHCALLVLLWSCCQLQLLLLLAHHWTMRFDCFLCEVRGVELAAICICIFFLTFVDNGRRFSRHPVVVLIFLFLCRTGTRTGSLARSTRLPTPMSDATCGANQKVDERVGTIFLSRIQY